MRNTDFTALSLGPALEKRQRTSEHIAESLRRAIRDGELADGSELNQGALARHFGVSRVPIREAMFRLEAEGWISAEPHRSAVVQAISRDRIVETFDLRILLERYLVERTVGRITRTAIDALEQQCDAMERITNRQEWLSANNAFHRDLYEASGAETSLALLEKLTSQTMRYVPVQRGGFARAPEAIAEHRAVVRAVRAGDVAEAQRVLQAHIETTLGFIIRGLEAATSTPA